MLESLLNPRHDLVRQMTAGLLCQIARSPSGHLAVLSLLDGGMAQAERVPHHCTEFFKLLSDLLSTITSAPLEVEFLKLHVLPLTTLGVRFRTVSLVTNLSGTSEGPHALFKTSQPI